MLRFRIIAPFVAGILIGAGSVEGFHIVSDKRRRELFEQKIRCKNLAEEYARKNSDGYTSVMLDRADFSVGRNSCVASGSSVAGDRFWTYEVIDVVTGDVLFSDSCDEKNFGSMYFTQRTV